jgi:hypothetical protein
MGKRPALPAQGREALPGCLRLILPGMVVVLVAAKRGIQLRSGGDRRQDRRDRGTNFKASIPDHKFRAEFVDLLRIIDRGDMAPRELHGD